MSQQTQAIPILAQPQFRKGCECPVTPVSFQPKNQWKLRSKHTEYFHIK